MPRRLLTRRLRWIANHEQKLLLIVGVNRILVFMVLPQHLIAAFFVATAGLFVTVLPEVIVPIIFSPFVAHVVYV